MTHDHHGRVLDVGRRTRTIPTAIRRALEHRDRSCCFPGCTNRITDAHHVVHWADGGPTRLENLLLLCRRHHRAVHEEGFRVTTTASGSFTFRRPDGRALPQTPPMPVRSRHPATDTTEPLTRLESGDGVRRCRQPLDKTSPNRRAGVQCAPYERLDLDWTMRTLYPRKFEWYDAADVTRTVMPDAGAGAFPTLPCRHDKRLPFLDDIRRELRPSAAADVSRRVDRSRRNEQDAAGLERHGRLALELILEPALDDCRRSLHPDGCVWRPPPPARSRRGPARSRVRGRSDRGAGDQCA